jgi:hypothetical protein
MTTVVAQPLKARAEGTHDRAFYSGMAILMALTVVAGFGPTYYFRALTGRPTFSGITTLTPLLQVHGALFTAWVVLFIVQTALVARHKVAVHRRLGIAAVGLAAAMIVVGYQTAIAAAQRGSAPPGIPPLAFLVVPIFDIALFAGFVTAAVVMRKKKEAHKRLMLLAYVSIIVAAVARIPGVIAGGPFAFFGLAFVFIALGAAYDLWSRGRINPVYLWGGAIFLASVPGRLLLSGTQAWNSFASFLIR